MQVDGRGRGLWVSEFAFWILGSLEMPKGKISDYMGTIRRWYPHCLMTLSEEDSNTLPLIDDLVGIMKCLNSTDGQVVFLANFVYKHHNNSQTQGPRIPFLADITIITTLTQWKQVIFEPLLRHFSHPSIIPAKSSYPCNMISVMTISGDCNLNSLIHICLGFAYKNGILSDLFTMSCSEIDPYCVSYPAIVPPLLQVLIEIAAESIAYGKPMI